MRWISLWMLWLVLAMAPRAHAAPFAYVANNGDDSLSVIDTATNAVATTVPIGIDPLGVAVDPLGVRVYVSNQISNGTLQVLDGPTHTLVTTVPIGDTPTGVAVKLPGTVLYAANRDSKDVSVVDTLTNTVVDTVPVENNPYGVAFNPAGTPAYVVNTGSESLSVIDTNTHTVLTTVTVGPPGTNPTHVAVNPSGSRVFVSNNGGANVAVLNAATNSVITNVPVGTFPEGLAVSPNGARVYVANRGPGTVSVIDVASLSVIDTIPVGENPEDLAIDPTGARLYVANRGAGDNYVSVIDTATLSVIDTIPVGQGPVGVSQFIVPSLVPPTFAKKARACQGAIASRGQKFAAVDHAQQSACRTRVFKALSTGSGMQQANVACTLALNLGDPRSIRARARSAALSRAVKKCAGLDPAALNAPCTRGAATIDQTVGCVLDQHLTQVAELISEQYGDEEPLTAPALACQTAIGKRGRKIETLAHKRLSACLLRLLKDTAAGKSIERTAGKCRGALDLANPASALSRARTRAAAGISRACAGVTPAAIGQPCAPSATTIDEVATCVLDAQGARAAKMVAAEFNDTCPMLTGIGLGRAFAAACTGP